MQSCECLAPGGDFSRVLDALPGVGTCWSFKETISKLFLLAEGRCCPGLVGRGARFASGGSAELVPSGTFPFGGRDTRAALGVPQGLSCSYQLVPKPRWQPAIATSKRRMFVV